MARKKNRDDLTSKQESAPPAPAPDLGRQPRILGWLVLIAGASSTWYWYRPLPASLNETANPTLSLGLPNPTSGPKSLWTEQALVVPSLEPTDLPPTPPKELLSNLDKESQLVGPPKVSLTPWNEWNEPRQSIGDALKTEVIPKVPIEAILSKSVKDPSPKPWTPDQQLSSLPIKRNESHPWPDVGYKPKLSPAKEKQRAATAITTQIPPLLDAGMRSIRSEDDRPASVGVNESAESPEQIATPAANRKPAFIRQPGK